MTAMCHARIEELECEVLWWYKEHNEVNNRWENSYMWWTTNDNEDPELWQVAQPIMRVKGVELSTSIEESNGSMACVDTIKTTNFLSQPTYYSPYKLLVLNKGRLA